MRRHSTRPIENAQQAADARLRVRIYELMGSLLSLIGAQDMHATSASRSARRLEEPAVAGSSMSADEFSLLQAHGVVAAGGVARCRLRVANDAAAAASVTLYCSNFIADTGCEIPAVRVSVQPRQLTLQAHGEGEFELEVAVPEQTPRGNYSGLIRAMGNRHFRAVLSVEVS
jgi:hypothetical protein